MRTVMMSIFVYVMCIGALSLAGCTGATDGADVTAATGAEVVTIIDSAGRKVEVPQPVERIVSLAPANTETLFELGLGDKVVGVTTYDNYPEAVEKIEKVSDFISPNIEVITSVAPDLILATGGVQGETIALLEQTGAPVLVIDPMGIEGIMDSFMMIGQVTGTSSEASALVQRLRDEIAQIEADVRTNSVEGWTGRSFIEIGTNPLFTIGEGTLLDEMLAIAGGVNVVQESGYVGYSAEQVMTDDPQFYFATSGSGVTVEEIKAREGYGDMRAVKDGNIIILDEDIASRPGPRFVEGIRAIYNGLFK